MIKDIIGMLLIALGTLLYVVEVIGVFRFDYVLNRMHAVAIGDSLGIFMMLTGAVDTLMLSTVGDAAVGAVGTVNTYIGVFIIMFTIISSGMVAVMTQYIGAGRPGVAHQALKLGLIFNTAIGLAFTLFLTFGAEVLLRTVGIAANLMAPGRTYLQVVGAFCLCNAIMPI